MRASPASFHPSIPYAQIYQDIACRTIVETTGFRETGVYWDETDVFL